MRLLLRTKQPIFYTVRITMRTLHGVRYFHLTHMQITWCCLYVTFSRS